MARKDDIFKSFLDHPIIHEKYGIDKSKLPSKIDQGLKSEHLIVQTLALIISDLEKGINVSSEKQLYQKLTSFLTENSKL